MSPIVLSTCQLLVAAALLAVALPLSGAVVAIVLGVVVLRESVTMTVLAGIALVLAGVTLTRHLDRTSTAAGR